MELISRMLDGSIPYHFEGGPEPVRSGPGARQEDRIDHLKRVALFQECSRRQLKSVARIARVFQVSADTVITRAGAAGDEFFLIIDGSVRVQVSPDKEATLGPGAFFGEMSLLDGGPRSATVLAATPVRLLVITRPHFADLLQEVPGLTHTLLVTLSRRVREAEEREQRLASASTGL